MVFSFCLLYLKFTSSFTNESEAVIFIQICSFYQVADSYVISLFASFSTEKEGLDGSKKKV